MIMTSRLNAIRIALLAGVLLALVLAMPSCGGRGLAADLEAEFRNPPEAARPWVFWYWMNAAVSREGITADLEAMREAGIGGAYLMPIHGVANPSLVEPPAEQLSPTWWDMVRHAMHEADRLRLKLAMHACDGFATAGGPWITPELSMQKVVWTETLVAGGRRYEDTLPQPETNEGYYRDIAVLAFPSPEGAGISTRTVVPKVTTSLPGFDAQFLAGAGQGQRLRSEEPCWIQYTFDAPFTCRSITIRPDGTNYQSNRLVVEASDDGKNFHSIGQLEPPRHGWQDGDAPVTHAIRPTTARHFRFVYDKAGSEPGAEDLDSAKWRPVLKVRGIELSSEPRIHQFQGKSGVLWRVGHRTTATEVPDTLCVPLDRIIDISEHLAADGRLTWDVPAGRWTILRLGHTSTGHRNETGGGAKGLECDKFNPEAARLQFDRWFGEVIRQVGPELAGRVLTVFHVDSWECGSQNWSPVFRDEFRRRRGYDPLPYLPAMAGIPVQSADVSERFLHDVRQTIAELVVDNFYKPMAELAHAHGCRFSGECVAPTMTSDGMLHFGAVDVPMGEFWLRSPTHDKLNDMLDAISAAHVYGKQVVQAEAFTELRMAWDEHPAMLKAVGDRNYALGINRLVYHVFTHNPWLDRRPGMTLDGVGLYFQRDQTWWRPGRAWVEYAQRCQALLQQGRPVVDVAVLTGEEVPRRAVLPEQLVATLPGIFGAEVVEREANRLANRGEPLRQLPEGVTHSANITDPADWTDPLRGYAYDSINLDAFWQANVTNGRIKLPGAVSVTHASYALLVVPEARPMSPEDDLMSPELLIRLSSLLKTGATVLVSRRPDRSPSLENYPECDQIVRYVAGELWQGRGGEASKAEHGLTTWRFGKGRVVAGPFTDDSFESLGIARDFAARDSASKRAERIAWTHRTMPGAEIYFVSNQLDEPRVIEVSLRVAGKVPELWDPVTGETGPAHTWRTNEGRTILPLRLEASGSIFVVLRGRTTEAGRSDGPNWLEPQTVQQLDGPWQVSFDPGMGGPRDAVEFDQLVDWTSRGEPGIRHYSGTASYARTFTWRAPAGGRPRVWLDLGRVAHVAEVTVNGVPCGVAWTAPYRVEVTTALRPGENELRIDVTNTWANRLVGDDTRPKAERLTWTTAPDRWRGKPLLESGLVGPVSLVAE